LTLKREQEVAGWHRHETNGEVVSITTTPRDKKFDTLWICVKRTVNGVETHHIEYLNDNPEFPRREDFVTSLEEVDRLDDDETFQRALLEAQKTYIHLDNAATFDGSQRAVDAGASLTIGAVTGTSVNFTTSASVFTAGDVGNEIWVKSIDGTRFGRAEIVTFNSGTDVDVNIDVDFDSTDVLPAGEWYITASTITGLDNLEGLTVQVVTDGAIHPNRTVSGGTLDLEGGGVNGTSQTKKKSVWQVGMRLLDTSGLAFGTDYYCLDDRLLREAVHLMDNPPPLFTGDEVIKFDDGRLVDEGWQRSKRVVCAQTKPLPATVQMMVPYFSTSN